MANNKQNQQFFQGKECFSRMNFLYQASTLMAGRNDTLSSFYGQLCRNVGKKAVLRIDPEIKRNLCKRCFLALKPNVTADLDVVGHSAVEAATGAKAKRRRRKRKQTADNIDRNTSLIMTCRQCGFQRNFRLNEQYKFWLDQPESVAEATTLSDLTAAADSERAKEEEPERSANDRNSKKNASRSNERRDNMPVECAAVASQTRRIDDNAQR